jgi:hypothetical protein
VVTDIAGTKVDATNVGPDPETEKGGGDGDGADDGGELALDTPELGGEDFMLPFEARVARRRGIGSF